MNSLKGKRILIFQQRGWGKGIGRVLAKKLQAEGCQLAAITFKRTTHDLIKNQSEIDYKLIISNDDLVSRPQDYLGNDKYSMEEICDSLGVDSIWPIAMTIRNYVRSYKDKFYYSFKQNVSDETITDYIKATYKSIKIIQEKFKPDIIITPNFVESFHIMYNLFFEKIGVPMIGVFDIKIKGVYIFSQNFNANKNDFCTRVDQLNSGKFVSKNREKAKQYIKEFREVFKNPDYIKILPKRIPFLQKLRQEISPYYQIIKWYIKPQINYWESVGPTLDYKPPRVILRDHYCRKLYKRFANNYKYYPFESLGKFVYFPLQVQPEASLDVTAPFFNNQIEIARQTMMSLPDDYVLVVKDHPAMLELRNPSYLEKISRIPNVKLIDYRISSEEVLKKASLIVSPNSTTLAEAAFLKKPAIQFGNLGTTLKLPNVSKHTDMSTLHSKIKEMLEKNFEVEDYDICLENYVAAAYDTGFDFNYIRAWEKGIGDKEELWQIYKKEIEKLLQ